jgi:hypothetical protein
MGVMADLVVAVPLAGVATAGSMVLTFRSRLRRSVQLVPGRRVDVPWRWRWSPRRAPMLHRRLQRSCQVVLAATGGKAAYRSGPLRRRGRRRGEQETSILQTTGRALLDQAARVDLRLVAADRGGPAWRRLHLPMLASEVAGIEASCVRLAQLSHAFAAHLDSVTAPESLAPQPDLLLDAMEAALADLRQPDHVADS